ncbi:MAG: TSUP family transporter [Oscillospiraceae bacterium]|nr:TSUP family transporter [Oscillospiraceae bacterium]
MLESLPVILIVGTVLGILAGLGIGGGSLLILWLTMILKLPHEAARGINLLFFLPTATIACLFRWRQGRLALKKVLPGILAGCLAAGLFTALGSSIDTELLKKPFGILLLLTGLRELFYRPRKAR